MVVPIEALLGFGLLSASISWLLLIHPAIARRRTLAYEIALLRKAEEETGIPVVRLDVEAAAQPYADPADRRPRGIRPVPGQGTVVSRMRDRRCWGCA